MSTASTDRADYAKKINDADTNDLSNVILKGRLLIEAKDWLEHGEFGAMIEKDLRFTASVAQRLMAIARDKRITNPAHAQHLPSAWTTLYPLTLLSDEAFKEKLANGTINPKMTRKATCIPSSKTTADDGFRKYHITRDSCASFLATRNKNHRAYELVRLMKRLDVSLDDLSSTFELVKLRPTEVSLRDSERKARAAKTREAA